MGVSEQRAKPFLFFVKHSVDIINVSKQPESNVIKKIV